MPQLALAIIMVFAALGAHADAPKTWRVLPHESRLLFGGYVDGEEFAGDIERFEATVELDPDKPASGRIEARIDVTSVNTGAPHNDRELAGPRWFDTLSFARATFAASGFEPGELGYVGDATLTLKGVSRTFRFPFAWSVEGRRARLESAVELSRRDFDVGVGVPGSRGVADAVVVFVDLALEPAPP